MPPASTSVNRTRSTLRGLLVSGVVAATLVVSGCSAGSPTTLPSSTATETGRDAAASAALQSALDDTRAEGGFPGVIARVITPEGTWTGSSGTSGPDSTTPPTATDITRIGSVTKAMTGTVLLQLVDEGLISLDAPVSTYVPDAPNPTATIRQVADMTSGIPSYSLNDDWQQAYFAAPQTVYTPEEMVAFSASLTPEFASGEGWQYSNTNYVLLGMIFEKVTGTSATELFQERIFDPLGMTDSALPTGSSALPEPHLNGVTSQGAGGDATEWNPSYMYTAGEVTSTLDDLQKWAHGYFTGEGVLSPEMQQLRRDSVQASSAAGTPQGTGYGIAIGERDGWWGHSGSIPGFNTSVFHSYDSDTTVIVIVNSDTPMPEGGGPAVAAQNALIAALG